MQYAVTLVCCAFRIYRHCEDNSKHPLESHPNSTGALDGERLSNPTMIIRMILAISFLILALLLCTKFAFWFPPFSTRIRGKLASVRAEDPRPSAQLSAGVCTEQTWNSVALRLHERRVSGQQRSVFRQRFEVLVIGQISCGSPQNPILDQEFGVFSRFYLYALVSLFGEQHREDVRRRGHEGIQIPEGI